MEVQNAKNTNSTTQQTSGHVFNIPDKSQSNYKSGEDLSQTVLGEMEAIPYELENMTQAYQNLYDSTASLEATDLYVKFTPESYKELIELSDNDILLMDFPLEYEVIELGDYYLELNDGELPTLFSVVDINFDLSNYSHEVLEELYITDNPFLIIEAYQLKGMYNKVSDIEISIDDDIEIPNIVPEPPLEGCNAPCHWVLYNQNPLNEYPPDWAYKCDCPTPPSGQCESTWHSEKPYGRVTVDDTQLSTANDPSTFEGVSNIRVLIADGLSFWNYTIVSTNDNGCWITNKRMNGGCRIWIGFNSNKCKVRGIKNTNNIITWPMSFAVGIVDYVGQVSSNNLNNIEVNYHRSTNNTSNAFLYWSAATVNNSVQEFHTYALQEGINVPKNNLNMFINPQIDGGAAPMFREFSSFDIDNWAQSLTNLPTWQNIPIGQLIDNPEIRIAYMTVDAAIKSLEPDVLIGTTIFDSDRLKRLVYHEVAHSSHFTNTGKNYWLNVIIAESNAFLNTGNSHGNATFADADIIAVAESWAEHVALSFAHKTYPTDPVTSITKTYLELLEELLNESPNHIPIGLYHDLIDNGTEPPTSSAIDYVSGFTNQQMFDCLNQNTLEIDDFRTQLINNYLSSTSNSQTDVNNLFLSY